MSNFFSNKEVEDLLNAWEKEVDEKAAPKRKVVIKKKNPIKCECGADKVRTTHSNWCPKWEKIK